MSKQTIAFVKLGSFAHLNNIMLKFLQREFPQYRLEEIDVFEDLVHGYDPINFFHIAKLYGIGYPDVKGQLAKRLNRTPYHFYKIKKAVAKRLANRELAFTFQTQSMFDASIPGVPHFLYTDHTALANLQYPGYNRSNLPAPIWIECEKQIYNNAACNFTMSKHVSRSMIEDYQCKPEQVNIVYCGPLTENTIPINEQRYTRQNVLFVGKKWERKGGPALVRAFEEVQKALSEASLTVVGCTPGLPIPNTQVHNWVPLAQLDQFYRQATVFCMPTRRQPFGLVYLAAMSHGLPIVATNFGALPDLVKHGETGYLIGDEDVESLAKYLIEILNDPAKAKSMGLKGKAHFEAHYNWSNTFQLMKESIAERL